MKIGKRTYREKRMTEQDKIQLGLKPKKEKKEIKKPFKKSFDKSFDKDEK